MGKMGSCSASLEYRSYACDASLLQEGSNLIAVQVWSPGGSLTPDSDRVFTFMSGAIAAGNDALPATEITVGEAIARCGEVRKSRLWEGSKSRYVRSSPGAVRM